MVVRRSWGAGSRVAGVGSRGWDVAWGEAGRVFRERDEEREVVDQVGHRWHFFVHVLCHVPRFKPFGACAL